MPYRRSGYVYQQPPSILHYVLSGLGQAAESLAQAYVQKKLREGQLTTNVLEGVLSGQTDPAVFATGMAQDIMRSRGISEQPQIKNLTAQALEKFQTPEKTMTSPSGAMVNIPGAQPSAIPLDLYQKYQAEREAALRRQKFYQEELPEAEAKEAMQLRVRHEYELKYKETPEETIQHVAAIRDAARKQGVNLENYNYNGVDLYTAYEEASDALKITTDKNAKVVEAQGKYNRALTDLQEKKARAVETITGYKTGKVPDSNLAEVMGIMGVSSEKIDSFMNKPREKRTPNDMKWVLFEVNKALKYGDAEIKGYGRQALMKPSEIEEIGPISEDILGDIEAPTSTPNPRGQLKISGRAESGAAAKAEEAKGREPSPAEVEMEAQKILSDPRKFIDPETGQLFTMGRARQIARKFLLWKQRKGNR